MKNLTITIISTLLALMTLVSPVQAEMATMDEALTVADNWVALIMQKEGYWGGSEWAEVAEIQEFTRGERLLGYFCRVNPKGYIVVSLRKELAPVKAYSATCDLDPESDEGMTDVIKLGMEGTLNEIEKQAGSIRLAVAQDVQKVVETDYRPDWEELELDPELFDAGLESGVVLMNYAGGQVLLTSNWHQRPPYNEKCPAVYEWNLSPSGRPTQGRKLCDHGLVGCVALAGAQIMRYWAWPPEGEGHHGDVYYDDPYDWANMPDTLTTSSPQFQIRAVAELCREAGRAAGTSYACIGGISTAWCGDKPLDKDMLDAYEDHFRYSDEAYFDWRVGESTDSWFNKIKNNINKNRPLQYCISDPMHSMVCDGWRIDGQTRRVHLKNWWEDAASDTWYNISDLPGAEGIIRGIRPAPSLGSQLENKVYPATIPTIPGISGTQMPIARYFDRDCTGDNVTFEAGHYHLQFLPGVTVTCTGGYIRFEGTSSESTRLLSFKGTKDGMLLAGIRIYNGGIRLYHNGSLKFHSSGPVAEPAAEPVSLTLTAPNGGEDLCTDSRYSIVWQTQGTIRNVDIQYSTDNGATWYRVAYNVGNTGSYDWLVSAGAIISDQCLVRIKDASNPSVFDTSDSTFSIMICVPECPPPPTGVSATQGPGPGQIVLRWNRSPDATGYKIFYDEDASNPPFSPTQDGSPSSGSGVGNVTQVTIRGLTGGEIYYFAVKAYNATCESDYSAQDSELVPSGPVEPGVCCYAPGDRVRLLVSNPNFAVGLPAGTYGTVLCCDADDPDMPIFVSWDGWTEGWDKDEYCDIPPGPYPPESGYWVSCDQIEPFTGPRETAFCDIPYPAGARVRLRVSSPRGAAGLVADMLGTVICCDYDDPDLPIFVSWDGWSNGRNSDSYCDTSVWSYPADSGWWMACHEIEPFTGPRETSCCDIPYPAGARVRLRVSSPRGAAGLVVGMLGTVICCDYDDPDLPIFVSWDGWSNGRNSDSYCDTSVWSYPADSGWWMACHEIEPFTRRTMILKITTTTNQTEYSRRG